MRTQTTQKRVKFASALRSHLLRVFALFALVYFPVSLLVVSIAPPDISASTISRSYRVDGNPTNGNVVSLDGSQSDVAHLANIENSSNLLGVVTGQDDSLVAIDPTDDTVQVAIGGTVPTLVSTIGGDIRKGDLISVSPLIGLGMKAQTGLPIIGRATTDFSVSNATTRQVTDESGKSRNVQISFMNVEIRINTSVSGDASLNSLQRIVKRLTGKVIPTIRIILSLVIAIIAIVTLVILIYASIFGSIISIGRNPLAKSAIMRSLRSVLVLALLLTVVTGVALVLLLS